MRHETLGVLLAAWRNGKRVELSRRLRIVILARQGWSAVLIGKAVGLSDRSVRRGVVRYNTEGRAGLETCPGQGRKPALNAEEQQLRTRARDGPPVA